jgi:hypothetical protein
MNIAAVFIDSLIILYVSKNIDITAEKFPIDFLSDEATKY